MSENLSIDEIIKRAEEIKAEADRQLKEAEQSLDKKAKLAINEIVVDEKAIVDKIAEDQRILEEEDEDVKEYVPPKKNNGFVSKFKTRRIEIEDEDEDIKIVDDFSSIKIPEKADDNTKAIRIDFEKKKTTKANTDLENAKTGVMPDLAISKTAVFEKGIGLDEKTRQVAFISNAETDNKSDLQSIPTIVAKEQIFDDDTKNAEEEIGMQITFDGFDDTMESIPTIDEEVAEQILEQRRMEKVGKFRLFGPDETDQELGNSDVVKDDYASHSEKSSFIEKLIATKSATQLKIFITLGIGAIILGLSLLFKHDLVPNFLSTSAGRGYFIVQIILFIGVIATNLNVFKHGINVFKGVNSDFPVAITAVLVLVHSFAMLIHRDLRLDNGVLLTLVSTFAILMSQIGKRQMMARLIDNFSFITDGQDKYTVENIANAVDAEVISRGLLEEDEPIIKTSVKADFPTNFLEISCKNEPADRISKYIFIVSLVLSLALTIALTIRDSLFTGLNIGLCGLTASAPVALLFLTNSMLGDVSLALNEYGSRVCGYEGAVMAEDANAMVMEASDLFGKDSCDIYGIKTFNGAKVDDAIIQAAAVIIQTKSPLAHAFDDVIIGKQSILPKVEGVIYEEKMGTSAWIYKRKVLVGNRDLLINHGVTVPNEAFEKRHTIKGRKALYLAVNGKIIAMFVVSYSADPDLKHELKRLEHSGINIIVKSCDPYINETSIAELFNLPEGFIRVMNYSAARVYDKYSSLNVEKSPAYVVHNGTALGFVSAMRGAKAILSSKAVIQFLQSFGCALGFAVIVLLSLMGAYSQIEALKIVLFQIIWSFFVLIISKLKNLSL